MINPEELRLNNIVAPASGIPKKVSFINKDGVELNDNGFISFCTLDLLNGIRLTEEWLLRFGFKYVKDKNMCPAIFTPCGKGIAYKNSHIYFVGVCIEVPILYIHQLQNLYFALTGEELTIKQ